MGEKGSSVVTLAKCVHQSGHKMADVTVNDYPYREVQIIATGYHFSLK